jgi:uncharacterized membrane protein YfcA
MRGDNGRRGTDMRRKEHAMQIDVTTVIGLLAVGVAIGAVSGMLGIGGGIFVIPALVFFFGLTHTQAVGTSLGMLLPPIGIFAFLAYYRAGHVNMPIAMFCAIGFAIGAYFGSRLVTRGVVPEGTLRMLFAFFMLYIAGNILFRGEPRVRAATSTVALLAAYGVARFVMKLVGRRWEKRPAAAELYRERVRHPFEPDYEI